MREFYLRFSITQDNFSLLSSRGSIHKPQMVLYKPGVMLQAKEGEEGTNEITLPLLLHYSGQFLPPLPEVLFISHKWYYISRE
jgi:hypothetical protein